MSIRARVLMALTVVLTGCGNNVPAQRDINCEPTSPTTVTVSVTPVFTPTLKEQIAAVRTRSPELADFIKKLYTDYRNKSSLYREWTPLHQYIYIRHIDGLKIFGFPNRPLSRERVRMYVYALNEYPARFGNDRDWFIAQIDHETRFVNKIGDRSRNSKKMPKFLWSYGPGQVQFGSAKWNLISRGIRGLREEDLVDFPLLNLNISASIIAAKVRELGSYEKGLQCYNGGDNGWKDGRSKPYLRKVTEIYNNRAVWY